MPTRRSVLRVLAGGVASVPLAGCGNPNSTPVRKLKIIDPNINESENGWAVSFDVVNTHQAADELAVFPEVEAIGYSDDLDRVCSEPIGAVTAEITRSNPISVEMQCSRLPRMITFDTEASPCDEDVRTVIDIATYDQQDGWCLLHWRRCNEGLPPEPREVCEIEGDRSTN